MTGEDSIVYLTTHMRASDSPDPVAFTAQIYSFIRFRPSVPAHV